jgi:hypothetical protein
MFSREGAKFPKRGPKFGPGRPNFWGTGNVKRQISRWAITLRFEKKVD